MVNFKFAKFHCYQQIQSFLITPNFKNRLKNFQYNIQYNWADTGVIGVIDPSWPGSASDWLKEVPWGINRLLVWIKNHYDNPPVVITENGFSDYGQLDDYDRADYYKRYLYEILKAINEEECNVIGYTAWSLMDNFEWMAGYT
jgi:beta-glucosidase/6-phospho-beta-glucosidase/beta-galactosidase